MVNDARLVPPPGEKRDRRRVAAQRPEGKRRRRLALVIIGIFTLMITGVILAGYVMIFVLPPRQLVVRVNDVKYTRGDMVKLLRVRQTQVQRAGEPFNSTQDIFQALQFLVENELIEQLAPTYGVTVSDEELVADIRLILGPSEAESAGQDPDQIKREFRERYTSYLNTIQLDKSTYEAQVRKTILRRKFRQFIGEKVPAVAEQVHVYRAIVGADDELAVLPVKYTNALGDNTDPESYQRAFKQIVREFSRDDPETIRLGGDLGWVPRGILEDYDDVIFNLEPGQLSELFPDFDSSSQMIYFMVSETAAARELDPEDLDALKSQALQDWLNEERFNNDVWSKFNSDIYSWMIKQLKLTTSATPDPPDTRRDGFGS